MQNLGGVLGTASLATLKLAGCERSQPELLVGLEPRSAFPRETRRWSILTSPQATPKHTPTAAGAASAQVRGKGLLGGAFIGMEPEDEADGPDLLAGNSCLFN